jgi:outer membrane protein assembly factor BamB
MRSYRILGSIAIALLAFGCSKEKEIAPPAELVDFSPQLRTSRAWSAGAGGGGDVDVLRLGLRPAVADGRVYVAGHGGDIAGIELATGRSLWRTKTKLPLSGGPATGEGIVVAGASSGELVALDVESGAERWRVPVGGEVLVAPVIAGGLVVVRTVDGRLRALRANDGTEAWVYEQPVPRLTLRGNGAPVVSGDMVIAGFDNGKVVAVSLATGELLWSATVAPSQGRTEIERLVDIDSPVTVSGQDIYVVGYQGRIAMLARDSGQIWWGRELSSHRGLAVDSSYLYVTTANSTVVALRRRDGTEVWRQEQLLHRSLTRPVLSGNAVVVGDFDGYVHWLDAVTGDLLARVKSGGRITNAPVAAGELLLFQTDSGNVEAWRAVSPDAG